MIKILKTKDNSPTLYSSTFDQTYHSVHGAIGESMHVFIENGLKTVEKHTEISVFEMGYGTGINALLSFLYAQDNKIKLYYESIEKFPVPASVFQNLILEKESMSTELWNLNQLEWNVRHKINERFELKKIEIDLVEYNPTAQFDIVYFDAFSPSSQPELWERNTMDKMYQMLHINGILTTYCAKGDVKRTLKASGFDVIVKPGPVGKREMTYAVKR